MKIIAIYIAVIVVCATPYITNGYKLSKCDFEENYKCEAIHGIGVIVPPAALVTMWFAADK